jgi:hypothetical protein
MDIDDGPRELQNKDMRQNLHVARQNHQINLEFVQHVRLLSVRLNFSFWSLASV